MTHGHADTAGLIDLIRKGRFRAEEKVVFLHTSGAVGLFGYPDAFDMPPDRPAEAA